MTQRMKLLLENRFPRIWVPSPENRDLRQLLWHRHRLVQIRTRIMNQLQAVAMNEGYRWKKKLFSEKGRAQLEKLSLAPWASRRRKELLELLDQLDPKTAELTAAVEQEAKKRPEVVQLMTHPGGTHHGTGLRSGHRDAGAVSLRQAGRQLHWAHSVRGLQCRPATAGTHQQTREHSTAFFAGGSIASSRAVQPGLATSVSALDDAPGKKNCQSGHGQKTCRSVVLDVAQWLELFADGRVRFARGKARNRTWREIARRPLDWASRSLQREFEVVIMVEVLIGEMFGSNR
jgi:hypothetical protein